MTGDGVQIHSIAHPRGSLWNRLRWNPLTLWFHSRRFGLRNTEVVEVEISDAPKPISILNNARSGGGGQGPY